MFPSPLHPAVVHFPIALVILLPLGAIAALIVIRRGAPANFAWLPVLALAGGLALSSWVAVQTGEREEEAVERVVPRGAFHEHEERAELFLLFSVVGVMVVAGGLAPGRPGAVMRNVALAASLVLLAAGYRVGHSGGRLVYEYGAASAYSAAPSSSESSSGLDEEEADELEESDGR